MCVGFVVAKKMLCLLCFRVVCRACRSINSMSGWQSYIWRPTAELEQLRVEARSRGVEWLLTAVAALQRDEVRKLAQAAGLPARGAGGGWIPVAELREALVKHLAPQAKASKKNSCVRFRILLLLFGLRPN